MLGIVFYRKIVDFNDAVTLKSGSKVTRGHRNRHGSIHHPWFPINVL